MKPQNEDFYLSQISEKTIVGAMIVRAMIIGAMIVGAMIVGAMIVGAMIIGAMRLSRINKLCGSGAMFHETMLSRINLWTDNRINVIEYKSFHNFTHTVEK